MLIALVCIVFLFALLAAHNDAIADFLIFSYHYEIDLICNCALISTMQAFYSPILRIINVCDCSK